MSSSTEPKVQKSFLQVPQQQWFLIGGILLIAALLRFLGIWHDWPYSYYRDELTFVKRSLAFSAFDFNPHWFHKPAFYMYLLFFEYGLFYLVGKVIGLWETAVEMAVSYIRNPGPFYVLGRSLTTLFSLGTLIMVYKIGEEHFKRHVGLIAALLLTLSWGHIEASQNVKADIPASFFGIFSMYFLLNFLNKKNIKDFILSAAIAGIGTATKYYPIVMLLPLLGVALVTSIGSQERLGQKMIKWLSLTLLALFAFYAAYFICAPFNFLDPLGRHDTFKGFYKLYGKISTLIVGSSVDKAPSDFFVYQMSYWEGFIDYVATLTAKRGMGMLIGIISIIGFLILPFRSFMTRAFFMLYPVIFIFVAIFLSPGYSDPRHQMPIYPFLAIGGGWLIVLLAGTSRTRQRIVYSLFLISLLIPFTTVVERGIVVSKKDTRQLAKEWVEKNVPANSRLLLADNGPHFLKNEATLQREVDLKAELKEIVAQSPGQFTTHYNRFIGYQKLANDGQIAYDVTEFRFPWWLESFKEEAPTHLTTEHDIDMGNPLRPHGVHPYRYYVDQGYEYVIINHHRYEVYILKGKGRYPTFLKFYEDLFEHGNLVKEFRPDDDKRPGPIVQIYKLQPEPKTKN